MKTPTILPESSKSLRPCYIHIGAPKTGTTFLQKYCFEKRDFLLKAGLLYPDVSLRGYGHHDLAFLLNGGYPDWAIPQPQPLQILSTELKNAVEGHAGPILISSENFYLFPQPERLLDLLEIAGILKHYRPLIVVYLRRQDDAHESWYNQTVKAQGYSHSIEECIEHYIDLWDYRTQLERWERVFGRENLIVRSYEKGQLTDGGLLRDFLTHVGVHLDILPADSEMVNTGLNRDLLEFQRLVNRLPLSPLDKRRFRSELIALTELASGTGIFDELPLLDAAMRKRLLQRYEESNHEVAMTYFGRRELFLECPDDTVVSGTQWTGLSSERLAMILGWLMCRQDGK